MSCGIVVYWKYLTQNQIIFNGNQRLTNDERFSIKYTQDLKCDNASDHIFILTLQSPGRLDEGFYQCQISGTDLNVFYNLIFVDEPAIPTPEDLHMKNCCENEDVSRECLPVCSHSNVSASFNYEDACLYDILKLHKCGTSGRTVEGCCVKSGVPFECLVMCRSVDDATLMYHSCVKYLHKIISCFSLGDVLPTPPRQVNVIPNKTISDFTLIVEWSVPEYNSNHLIGYKVFYRALSDVHYKSSKLINPAVLQYTIQSVHRYQRYNVYVIAASQHGASPASELFELVADDSVPAGRGRNILECCQNRGVSENCRLHLCSPHVWHSFNSTLMMICQRELQDIFSCLGGERNNSFCCSSYGVPDICVGMCSGKPPVFDNTLAFCITSLSIIEGCIEEGLGVEPFIPVSLKLIDVTATTAEISWDEPLMNKTSDVHYMIYLQHGPGSSNFNNEIISTSGRSVTLQNLTEQQSYSVRVVAATPVATSLPSAAVRFTTYPNQKKEKKIQILHNFTQCCMDMKMPRECYLGCKYMKGMIDFFRLHLDACQSHIGSVLTCGADGRDHMNCCVGKVQIQCLPMCYIDSPGHLHEQLMPCMGDTDAIIECFSTGIKGNVLLRKPENLIVRNVSSHSITIDWDGPDTGPSPSAYLVQLFSDADREWKQENAMRKQIHIIQHLIPATMYKIRVLSFLNDTVSPTTNTLTVFTESLDQPVQFNSSIAKMALWINRTHCCQNSNISLECQPVCLNSLTQRSLNCSMDIHKMLACVADGADHSICCQQRGIQSACLSLCNGQFSLDLNPSRIGCLVNDYISTILSCFFSNSGLLPSMPHEFMVKLDGSIITMNWMSATNCGSSPCSYGLYMLDDEHFTIGSVEINSSTNSFDLIDVRPGTYTFALTARNDKGSGPSTPWQTLVVSEMEFADFHDHTLTIIQKPESAGGIYDQDVSVMMLCEYSIQHENSSVTIQWIFRGQIIDTQFLDTVSLRTSTFSEGCYSCHVCLNSTTILSASIYINVRFQPELIHCSTDSVRPNSGETADLSCWFRGHPDTHSLESVWSVDGRPIMFSPNTNVSFTEDFQTGFTEFRLRIFSAMESDFCQYTCTVFNKYGTATGSSHMSYYIEVPLLFNSTTDFRENLIGCCTQKHIHEMCSPMCRLELSTAEALVRPDEYGICLLYFYHLVQCAADGSDHSMCCKDRNIPESCLPFCSGHFSPMDNFTYPYDCFQHTPTILECSAFGYNIIPSVPVAVTAVFFANCILVFWRPPLLNVDQLAGYTIYYKSSKNMIIHNQSVESTEIMYKMCDFNIGHVYDIWMTADCDGKGRSQRSNIFRLSLKDALPISPTNLQVTDVEQTSARLLWEHVSTDSEQRAFFAVHYKPISFESYIIEIVAHNWFILRSLAPCTIYIAYVSSLAESGQGSSSPYITFTTQALLSSQLGKYVAIAVSIVVLIAAISLCVFFIIRKKISFANSKLLHKGVSFKKFGNDQLPEIDLQVGNIGQDIEHLSVMQYVADGGGDGEMFRRSSLAGFSMTSDAELIVPERESVFHKLEITPNCALSLLSSR